MGNLCQICGNLLFAAYISEGYQLLAAAEREIVEVEHGGEFQLEAAPELRGVEYFQTVIAPCRAASAGAYAEEGVIEVEPLPVSFSGSVAAVVESHQVLAII